MAVKFIFSEIENELKSLCIDKVVSSSNNKQLLIVPEQNTLTTDTQLINKSQNNAFLFANVLSFKRLAFYVLNETEVGSKENLTNIGRILVIKKVLHEVQDELVYFKNSITRPGFATQISETLNQMARYNFKSDEFNNLIDIFNSKSNSTSFQLKLKDLNLIFNAFNKKIEENYFTTDDLLHILAKNIKHSEYIKGLDVYINSFYSYSVLENTVILELAKYCNSLIITLPLSKKDNLDTLRSNEVELSDFYFEPKKAAKQLLKLFDNTENLKVEFEHLKSMSRNENIQYLLDNYGKSVTTKKQQEKKDFADNTVQFYECENKYAETEFIANLINEKIIEGYRYKDIVLVCPDIDSYSYIIKNVFDKQNIPLFYDKKDMLFKNRVVECICSALDVVVKNFKYESLFRFLKSGVIDFETEKLSMFENYIVEYGIRNYMWNFERWSYGQHSVKQVYDLDEINEFKNLVLDLLSPLQNKKLTIKEHCRNLYDFIEKIEVFKYIETKVIDENTPINVKRELELVWSKTIEIIEQMYDVLGEEVVTLEEFVSIFESGVREEDFGHIPTYDDQVVIANINRSKIESAKVMIFMDCTDRNYPKYTEQNIIFDTEECENILNTGYKILDSSLERLYAQNLAMYLYIAKVENELIFTKAKATFKGDELKPAKVVVNIQKLLNKPFTEDTTVKFTYSNKESVKRNIKSYAKNDDVFNWYKNATGRINRELFENIENEEFFNYNLSKDIIEKLYGNEILASVSKFEKYVQCPYAYHLTYNIKGRPKREYQANSMDYGQLFHKLFEIFVTNVQLAKTNWKDIDDEYISKFVDEQIEFVIINMNKEIFTRDSRYKVYLDRIADISKISIKAIVYHIVSGEYEEIYSEASFKNKGGDLNVLNVKIGDKNIRVSGEIDRVDLMRVTEKDDDGNLVENCYVKIVDYKSSKKSFSLNDFYNGIQLQLIVYLDSVLKNSERLLKNTRFDTINEAGVFYFTAQNPILDKSIVKDIAEVDKEILQQFRMNGIFNGNENVVYAIDKFLKKPEELKSLGDGYNDYKSDSDVINAKYTTKGEFYSSSGNVDKENMKMYREYSNSKIKDIGESIFEGNIEAKPVKNKDFVYCTYCNFKNICMIELKDDKGKYKELEQLSAGEINKRIMESLED